MQYDQRLAPRIRKLSESMSRDQIVEALAAQKGYTKAVAQRLVHAVLDLDGNNNLLPLHTTARAATPDLGVERRAGVFTVEGHQMQLAFQLLHPRIAMVMDFATDDECAQLAEELKRKLRKVATPDGLHPDEHSGGVWPKHKEHLRRPSDIGMRLTRRLAALMNWPVSMTGDWGAVSYAEHTAKPWHQDYAYDLTPDKAPGVATSPTGDKPLELMQLRTTRLLSTALLYLEEPEAGGETGFANIGMYVAPLKRSLLVFSYPTNSEQDSMLHTGIAVTKGSKLIATNAMFEPLQRE